MNFPKTCNFLTLLGIVLGFTHFVFAWAWLAALACYFLAVIFGLLALSGVGRPVGTRVPWVSLTISGLLVGLVLLVAGMTHSAVEKAKQTDERTKHEPVIDQEHGFRLDPPPGWTMEDRAQLQKTNPLIMAGANGPQGTFGLILVEHLPQTVEITGDDVKYGKNAMKNIKLQHQNTESSREITYKGIKAFRFRMTGTDATGQPMRVENTVFLHRGYLFQVYVGGPTAATAPDGSSFRPFENALTLLPE